MSVRIREIKAVCQNHEEVRTIILSLNARYIGCDHQIDHYFKVRRGRLKLRNGSIEKNLIYYQRPDQKGPKLSQVGLYSTPEPEKLDTLLSAALDTLVIVDKQREIYFVDNVKIHLDRVKDLGSFLEIEAIDEDDRFSDGELLHQCQQLMDLLKITPDDLISDSYSDMLLKMRTTS
ncbi:class IV adenylate cyclase [bacterium]|nr:class IV adenylate cyclase [bacterium]MBU1064828.1 class IV adenylate cyclase [bacterium]MBU1633808.1 class IV adenylate cyclase [bacterium]MBU1872895.1 class IV adenylate cyclase [bacterium]